jgi:hypothetical protein
MAHKQVHFRRPAREKIQRGASELADAVRVTLGPKSKCVPRYWRKKAKLTQDWIYHLNERPNSDPFKWVGDRR